MNTEMFENLFVLELANNHWGRLDRGKEIVRAFGEVAKKNNIKAAIKLQFRDVDNFVHQSFKGDDERYIKKTEATKMSKDDFKLLAAEIKDVGCIPMATPFDEASVDFCEELGFSIVKIASSDIDDGPLVEKIISLGKPTIVSTGGASLPTIDAIVAKFDEASVPLAINHCVSLYPSEDSQLELNQISLLANRYPDNLIGFSSHEMTDWTNSMLISYGLGARTWERHIDIEMDDIPVSPYCTLPRQADEWFKAFNKAKEMCGRSADKRREISNDEREYLDNLLRGYYARENISVGTEITSENLDDFLYLAIPLVKGQLACQDEISKIQVKTEIKKDEPVSIGSLENVSSLALTAMSRGR